VKLRNVVGLLRGADPALKDTYLLVTAHYDHDGINPRAQGDNVMNGANDDASGTASMIEIAAALAGSSQRPKRSILFMAYFGEERGLLGSRYYARNPIFPLAKTVANLNLEHMGRTDDNEGPQLKRGSFTGFDYSTLPEFLKQAGAEIGVEFFKHEKNSDSYFGRSDNQALADAGVPAHTLCVAFMFPDYHRPGDHWDKIDYDNMAVVTRAVVLGVWRLTGSAETVRWNEANPKAARYVKAAAALHGAH
jgi:Zn-dependent M28 family amino/carboxypeptidase